MDDTTLLLRQAQWILNELLDDEKDRDGITCLDNDLRDHARKTVDMISAANTAQVPEVKTVTPRQLAKRIAHGEKWMLDIPSADQQAPVCDRVTDEQIEELRDEHLYSVQGVVQGHEKFASALLSLLPKPDTAAPRNIDQEINIRNAALEEAAMLFPQPYREYFGDDIQEAIRALQSSPAQGQEAEKGSA